MISAIERVDDNRHFELCDNLQIAQEHGQMEIRKFPLSPDISPLKGFAIFSVFWESILELISKLEREDNAGHFDLSFKL